MSLTSLTKLQLGLLGFMTGLQGIRIADTAIKAATIATIAAVSIPAIICVSASIATGIASLAVGVLAEKTTLITKENAFRMTVALSAVTVIATIFAMSVIGVPAALAAPICITTLLYGISNCAFAALRRPDSYFMLG